MKSMIVAYDERRGIGVKGNLPWGRDLPADLNHFKSTTVGSTIIMGRVTYDSIGHALPERQNIVLSRQILKIGDAAVVRTFEDAIRYVESEDLFVIGGAEIYKQTLDYVDQIIVTEVHHHFEGTDAFFPDLPTSEWFETDRIDNSADQKNLYDHSFVTYART